MKNRARKSPQREVSGAQPHDTSPSSDTAETPQADRHPEAAEHDTAPGHAGPAELGPDRPGGALSAPIWIGLLITGVLVFGAVLLF